MSRRSLILCLAALAVLVIVTGTAVAFLYSGVDGGKGGKETRSADGAGQILLAAVPSDAVLLASYAKAGDAVHGTFAGIDVPDPVLKSPAVVSMHYAGGLMPLYIFDAGPASDVPSEDAATLIASLDKAGLLHEFLNCAGYEDAGRISRRSVVIASSSETLLKSSMRHLSKSVSIMDSPGFAEACASADGDNLLFLSNVHADQLLPSVLAKRYSSYSGFVTRLADWTVADVASSAGRTSFEGALVGDGDLSRFVNVLRKSSPAVSSVSEILPSYTLFAASLPMEEVEPYAEAYRSHLDSRQMMQKNMARKKELAGRMGIAPVEFFQAIGLKEIATASFMVGNATESVVLMKVDDMDVQLVFKGTDVTSLKDYEPKVHSWPYSGFASAVFGNLFGLKDESCFTFMNGWIISGSMKAVEEYAGGRALEYTLKEYMADASKEDLLSDGKHSFVSYFSFTAAQERLDGIFRPGFLRTFGSLWSDSDFCPSVISVTPDKDGKAVLKAEILKLELQKTKAPVFERDTVVNVPGGPFEVRNSGTGKMNRFYQNSHLSLCLSEEGRDLWGVPFDKPLCGTAHNVDYYANGKLQIIFGAGRDIYIIDRLGRYVSGFPVSLEKDILLGPDVYDFNGVKKYNIMVLHKDNTLEMYNLKGHKPSSWKGIRAPETIKSLPERIVAGGKSFWVVRTSIRTLIYPFYGGDALTTFEGDEMIRPDSEVKVTDGASADVVCYDGKHRTVSLK